MSTGMLKNCLRASKQLLMLHFLVPEAQQRPQMRAVVMPILLDDAGEVERDEFLIVAIQMRIAEGATMVERELFLVREELQGLGAYPEAGTMGLDVSKRGSRKSRRQTRRLSPMPPRSRRSLILE